MGFGESPFDPHSAVEDQPLARNELVASIRRPPDVTFAG